MSPSMLFQLPNELLSSIYEYDNTNRKIFKDSVVTKIQGGALKHSIKTTTPHVDKYFGGGGDSFSSDGEEVQDKINVLLCASAVKLATKYKCREMGFFDDYTKGECHYGIGNAFHFDDVSAVCIQLHDYIFNDLFVLADKFDKRTFISVRLFVKEKNVFDGGVYFDVNEFDDEGNENIMVLDYDNVKRMSLFMYLN